MSNNIKKVKHTPEVQEVKTKPKNLRFTKNPTGMFGLAYNENIKINSTALPEATIKELIEKGYLEECE